MDLNSRKGREDNFWAMSEGKGPCGPCTEIFWDQQKEVDNERFLFPDLLSLSHIPCLVSLSDSFIEIDMSLCF
jgi:alanyl-tRNA synthetase